jgi:hypothetical protein
MNSRSGAWDQTLPPGRLATLALVLSLLLSLMLGLMSLPSYAQLPGQEAEPAAEPVNCAVSGFRAAVTDAPEPLRAAKALEWLSAEGPRCSLDRWILIRNNRNQWMGSADSAQLAAAIDSRVEELARDDSAVIRNLFTSPPPPAPKKE